MGGSTAEPVRGTDSLGTGSWQVETPVGLLWIQVDPREQTLGGHNQREGG